MDTINPLAFTDSIDNEEPLISEGVLPPPDADQEEIVGFMETESVTRVEKDEMDPYPSKLEESLLEGQEHSINSFLKRPRLLDQNTWNTTDTVGTSISIIEIPDDILTTAMIACKLNDFRFVRWTTVIRVVVNTNPFSTGRLIGYAQPYIAERGQFASRNNITAWSGYPCVYVDAGSNNTVELRIPFVSWAFAYDLHNLTPGPWATFQLNVMNQLRIKNGTLNAHVAIYVWLEDVILSVPTPNQLTLPPKPLTSEFKTQQRVLKIKRLRDGKQRDAPRGNFQMTEGDQSISHVMNQLRNKNGTLIAYVHYTAPQGNFQMTEGDEEAETGSISSALNIASDVASTIGSFGVGPVAEAGAAAAWMFKMGSDIAETFGYSKPTSMKPVEPIVQQPAYGMTNYNGTSTSSVLGADRMNSLDIDKTLFGAKRDEMDINFVCSKENWLERYTWATTDVVGTVLKSWMVTPGLCASTSNVEYAQTTQLAYTTSMFKYWRGGLKYKFSFVANSQYSGTICFVFLSGHQTVPATMTLDDFEACPQIVCDIERSSECTLDVPYVLNYPYLKTKIMTREVTGSFAYTTGLVNSSGILACFVVTALRHNGSCEDTIDINTFISASEDFELAVPEFSIVAPFYGTIPAPLEPVKEIAKVKRGIFQMKKAKSATPAKKETSKSTDKAKVGSKQTSKPVSKVAKGPVKQEPKKNQKDVKPQEPRREDSKMQNQAGKPNPSKPLLNKESKAPVNVSAVTAIGERIKSLRPLTRMFSQCMDSADTPDEAIEFDPAFMGIDNNLYSARVQIIAALYAFYRGSMRWKFLPNNAPSGFPILGVYSDSLVGPPREPTYGTLSALSSAGIKFQYTQNMITTPVLEFANPYYRRQGVSLVTDQNIGEYRSSAIITSLTPAWTTLTGIFLCAMGDDGDFGYLVGAPVVVSLN